MYVKDEGVWKEVGGGGFSKVEIINSSTASNVPSGTAINPPSGAQAGDLLLIFCHTSGSGGEISPPAGYSQNEYAIWSLNRVYAFSKVSNGSDSVSFPATLGRYIFYAIRGHNGIGTGVSDAGAASSVWTPSFRSPYPEPSSLLFFCKYTTHNWAIRDGFFNLVPQSHSSAFISYPNIYRPQTQSGAQLDLVPRAGSSVIKVGVGVEVKSA